MIVVIEHYAVRKDGVVLKRTYSDIDHYIKNEVDQYYVEAIDVETTTHTYTETEYPIDEPLPWEVPDGLDESIE